MGKSEGEVVKPLINVCVKCGGMDVKSVGQSLGYCISCGSQIPFRIHPARIAAEGLVAKSEVAELVKALERIKDIEHWEHCGALLAFPLSIRNCNCHVGISLEALSNSKCGGK